MEAALEVIARVAMLIFVVASMATAGLGLAVRDCVAPLRRARLVVLSLAANFIVAPAVAWGLATVMGLETPHAIGLLLLGAAAGAPFLPKLAEVAKGDVAFSVGLMLLLTLGTAASMPIILPYIMPGLSVAAWPILRPILLTMLLPLLAGMAIRAGFGRWACRLRLPAAWISNVSMIVAVLLLIGLNFGAMLDVVGSGAIAAAILFVLAMVTIGYALGGQAVGTRSVLGLGTGQRNIAAALIVAAGNVDDPRVITMLLTSTLVGLLVLLPAARLFARMSMRETGRSVGRATQLIPQEVAR